MVPGRRPRPDSAMNKQKPQPVRIYMLGQFAVERGGEVIPSTAWKRRRPVELLAMIALSAGRIRHREEVIDRLWPDKDLEAGANNLYRAVHDLRRIVGEETVTFDRGVVGLASDAFVDVEAFEQAVASGDPASLEEAVGLYRGELLSDDPYASDLVVRRESLRQRFVDAGLQLAQHHRESDTTKQISMLRRVLEVDPTIQHAHRSLMQALVASGRRSDALRQFRECVKALREHLDAEPSPETLDLHAKIKATPDEPAPAPRDDSAAWNQLARRMLGTDEPAPLRGRSEALDHVRTLAEKRRGVLLIIGEAGVGKTRLAVETSRFASQAGSRLLAGAGYDFEGTAPYTPFVDAWSDYLRRNDLSLQGSPFATFEPTQGASAQEDRLRLFQTVERSLAELAAGQSACLLLEDVHLADESSLQLVHHLARTATHLPLLLVLTMREEEIRVGQPLHRLISGLGRERLASRVELRRLERTETRELISDLLDTEPNEAMLDEVYRLSEGNPFYTEELVRAMREGGGETVALPGDVLATVRHRVSRLGRGVERLLLSAAVVGQHFDFELVCRAAGIEVEQALEALELGIENRLIAEEDHQYRFRHALTREALYGGLTHARRVYLHRAVADALEKAVDQDTHAENLAFHHQAAGQIDRALPFLLAAAKRAMSRLGYGEAVGFFEQALELMDALGQDPGAERLEALLALGSMRVALGDLDDALRDLRTAAELESSDGWRPSVMQRAGALRLCALALIEAGDLEHAESTLEEALALLTKEATPDSEPAEMGNVLYLFAQLRWHQNRHDEAYDYAEQCLAQAEKLDEAVAIARGYEMLALACHSLGEWRKGTEFEERRQGVSNGALDVAGAFDAHL